jgi:hypothetical protein
MTSSADVRIRVLGGPTSPTLIELLEYVRRKAILPGPSWAVLATLSFACLNFFPLHCRIGFGRAGIPRDDVDDVVSVEIFP